MSEATAPRHRDGADRPAVAADVALPPATTRASHRAPRRTRRTASTLTRIGQGGVAGALLVAFGLAAVNPVQAAPADFTLPVPTVASAARDKIAVIERNRADLADVADSLLARVDVTRLDAVQAQVAPDKLAALLALSQQVDQLRRQVRGQVSVRSSYLDRLAADPASSPGTLAFAASVPLPAAAAAPTPPAAPTASATDAATAAAATLDPTVAPTADSTAAPTVAPTATDAATADAASVDPAATTSSAPLLDLAEAAPAPLAIAGEVSPTFVDPTAAVLDAAALDAVLATMPQVLASDDASAAALRDAVVALATAAADVSATADANRAAAAAAAAAAQAAKEAAAKEAALKAAAAAEEARRRALPRSADGYLNGEIPASALCHPTSNPSALLRCDAAKAFDQMDAAYVAAFGTHLVIGQSYRSYADQVLCRATKGYMCADPGTSNHGWGLAVDLAGDGHYYGTPTHLWLEAHAATYGWMLPAWAVQGGSKQEPWHWEYGV